MMATRTKCWRFETTRTGIHKILAQIRGFITHHDQSDIIELALTEALTNLVEHAFDDTGLGKVKISACANNQVWCEVHDTGCHYIPPTADARPPCSESGYGWILIRGLAKSAQLSRSEGKNVLVMQF